MATRKHRPQTQVGFLIPLDTWVNREFKEQLYETLLSSSSRLDEFFRPEAYRPILQAFCHGQRHPSISRQGLYQRAIMLLSMHLHLGRVRSGSSELQKAALVRP